MDSLTFATPRRAGSWRGSEGGHTGVAMGTPPQKGDCQLERMRLGEERRRSRHKLEVAAAEVERKIARLLTQVKNGAWILWRRATDQ